MALPTDNQTTDSSMPPEPVKDGIGWIGMIKLIIPGAIVVVAASGGAYTVAKCTRIDPPRYTLGVMMDPAMQWIEEPEEPQDEAPQTDPESDPGE